MGARRFSGKEVLWDLAPCSSDGVNRLSILFLRDLRDLTTWGCWETGRGIIGLAGASTAGNSWGANKVPIVFASKKPLGGGPGVGGRVLILLARGLISCDLRRANQIISVQR